MSRAFGEDFDQVIKFVEAYSISGKVTKDFRDRIRPFHKKTLSILTIVHSYLFEDKKRGHAFSEVQLNYLAEVGSDMSTALFEIIIGGYKPSRFMLRSAIESGMKFLFADLLPKITQEKSVFQIFDQIKHLSFIQDDNNMKQAFSSLKSSYAELCADVHTASPINMSHITGLRHYPAYDEHKLSTYRDVYTNVSRQLIFLAIAKFPSYYHALHHNNKDLILDALTKTQKGIINNPEMSE
jgi:hypothetical protein